MAAAILQIRRGTNASTGSITFSESELFYNQSKETLQISNGSNTLITLARLDRINTGSLHLTGDFTASNALFTGDITFGGSLITLGDSNTDNIVIGGELSSSMIPNNDNAFDLGSETRRYRGLYSVSGSIDNINGINFTTFVNSTNTFTSSQETKNSTLASYTASINADLTNLHLYTSSIDTKFTTLGSYTSSIDAKFNTLSTYTASINSDLSQLHTYTASVTADLTNLHTYTASVNADLTALHSYTASVTADLTQLHTYTSSVNSDLTQLHTYTASVNSDLTQLHTYTASVNSDLSNLHAYTSSINTKFTTLGSYTASIDSKFTTLGTYTSSIDSKFTTLGTYTSSIDSKFVAVGSTTASLNAYTASQDTKNATLATYTASVNSDLSNLHTYTASVNADLSQLHTYTSSLKSAIDVSGANLTIYGDLTVQGNTTTLNTSELIVEDKLLALASGSTTSAQADGAGLYISGANASMLWDNTNSNLVFNQKVSSSVGFKGNGSEITGVTAASVDYYNVTNRPVGIVSGSTSNERIASLTQSLDYRYLNVDGDSVVSGSSQIDATATTNWSTGIKTQLNNNTVISGSTQITNGSGLLSSSYTNFATYTQSIANDLIAIHSFTSSQETKNSTLATYTSSVDSKFTTIGTYTGSIDSKFNTLATYTASINADLTNLHSYTASNDTNVTKLFGTASAYSAFSSSINTTIKTKLDTEGVVSSSSDSSTIDFVITNGVITGNAIGGIVSGSSQVTQSLDTRYELSGSVAQLVGIRAVSGSLGSAAWYNVTSSGDIALVSGSITYNNNHLLTAGATKKYIDWRTDEILTAIAVADITSVNAGNGISGGGTTGDVTMSLDTGSAHFTGGVKTKLNTEGVISSSVQVVLEDTTFTDGLQYQFLQTDGSGSLSFADVYTMYDTVYAGESVVKGTPLYVSGSNGANPIVWKADASVASKAAIYIAADAITAGSTGRGILLGEIEGMNLTGINDSTQVYLAEGGGWSTTRPSGSNSIVQALGIVTKGGSGGKGQVLNPGPAVLPNLQGGYLWVGNGGNQPIVFSTSSFDNTALNSFTSSIDTTIKTKLNTEGVISGSSQLSGKVIPNLSGSFTGSYTGSFTGSFKGTLSGLADYALYPLVTNSGPTTDTSLFPIFTSNANVNQYATLLSHPSSSFFFNGVTRQLNAEGFVGAIYATNGVVSGSSQVLDILSSLNSYTSSQDTKNTTLGTYTGSIDTKFSTLSTYTASVNSSLSQLNAVSHSHSNKTQLDTINQNLASTSDVTFGSIHTSGTGSIGTNLTVYGNLTVFGTQSIINSTNLEVADNIIYLAPTASGDWDLGVVGHYNDGVYKHAGIFSDASDGHAWKVFKDLTSETTGSVDTSAPTFTLADFKAANFTGTSFNGTINATNGVISGSSQLTSSFDTRYLNTGGDGVISGSSQVSYVGLSNIPAGILSSSAQIDALFNLDGIVSSSSQITAGSTTNFATDVKTQLNSNTVVSGSSQISIQSTAGFGTYLNQGVLSTSDVRFNSLGIGMAASATTGRIDATNDIVAYSSSDRRFKDNIKPIENALDKINQIGGYEFDWKEENKIEHGYEGHDLGVIAQEIEAIAPELVQTRENGYKAVKYDKLVSVLIQAVKELSAKVTELENK